MSDWDPWPEFEVLDEKIEGLEATIDHYRSLLREAVEVLKPFAEAQCVLDPEETTLMVDDFQDARALLSRINEALGE